MPEGWSTIGFSPDGTSLIAVRTELGTVVRVQPIAGGAARDLATPDKNEPWTDAFTGDSRSVIVDADNLSQQQVHVVPIDGGPARVIRMPPSGPQGNVDVGVATGTHTSYVLNDTVRRLRRLVAVDVATGEVTILADIESAPAGTCCGTGPGGLYTDGDAFLIAERMGDRVETKSVRPGSPPRTLYSGPASTAVGELAFHGGRVAYRQRVGDSLAIMVSGPGAAPARVLVMVGGRELLPANLSQAPASGPLSTTQGSLAFSFDGQWLAISQQNASWAGEAMLVNVPSAGRATDIRRIPLDADSWFEPRWLPDNSGFTAIAVAETSWITLVPVSPNERVRHLTRGEGRSTWGHVVSPDGRWVAYPAEVIRGTTLWRWDFSDAIRRGG
jgi:hypothetical protein